MKVLVVDDERQVAAMLGRMLQRLGHEVVLSEHPADALERFDSDIDAVVSDIDMPIMDGVELARAIRDVAPRVPILFCTGSDPSSALVAEALLLGRVLPKPVGRAELERAVEGLQREHLEALFARGSATLDAPEQRRKHSRWRVWLPVRYQCGSQRRSDAACDLSIGGLFLRGGATLEPANRLQLEVEIPEHGRYRVDGRVTFTLDDIAAYVGNRVAGVGVEFVTPPAPFVAALEGYLSKLERRRDVDVLVTTERYRHLFAEAGYRAHRAPAAVALESTLRRLAMPMAIVVSPHEEAHYAAAAAACGLEDSVRVVRDVDELDDALGELDAKL